MASEAWDAQPFPHHSIIKHLAGMQKLNAKVMPLVHTHLQKLRRTQRWVYNYPPQPHTFPLGEKVQALIPDLLPGRGYTLQPLVKTGLS